MNKSVSTCQEEIAHIENQNERLPFDNLEVKVRISINSSEAHLHQVAIYPLVPCSRCLLQPMEGFLQTADMGVLILDFEPQRLFYIHLFLYRTMPQKTVFTSICSSKGDNRL